jgi:hypothetical protein
MNGDIMGKKIFEFNIEKTTKGKRINFYYAKKKHVEYKDMGIECIKFYFSGDELDRIPFCPETPKKEMSKKDALKLKRLFDSIYLEPQKYVIQNDNQGFRVFEKDYKERKKRPIAS